MQTTGEHWIGGQPSREGSLGFQAVNPGNSVAFGPEFVDATPSEIDRAMRLAHGAFESVSDLDPNARAELLDRMGEHLLALGDELIELTAAETGLGRDRLIGERARTVGQLRLFAALAREGSWVDARIDRANPVRQPLPKPDVRRMLLPAGPVVVFGASNFPLAFSVAGSDTASALAAGNPVVFKAHPAHPNTSEVIARATLKAVAECGLPDGLFSLIHGTGHDVGLELVRHPLTEAVAFTGSLRGGRALFAAAAARPRPIPLYAEMGSTNPIFILPGALAERGDRIAKELAQSVTLGVGQFCTNPGVVVGCQSAALDRLVEKTATQFRGMSPATMLYSSLCKAFSSAVERMGSLAGVKVEASGAPGDPARTHATPVLLSTEARVYLQSPALHEECFGPSTLLVRCVGPKELEEVARSLEGQLTATIHGTPADLADYATLVRVLRRKVGRLLFNGYPTGVEVCSAMHHGGPYPATTDWHFTSVGSAAIHRFARPVCFQNFPDEALPPELQNQNPRRIRRLVDDALSDAPIP